MNEGMGSKPEMRETGAQRERRLVEGVDFYFERGFMVLTEKFLRDRGYCCGNGCRHCPYPDSEIQRKGREGR